MTMTKLPLLLCMLIAPCISFGADLIGRWQYPVELNEWITGFRFYVNGIEVGSVASDVREIDASSIGVMPTDSSITITAFRDDQESLPSIANFYLEPPSEAEFSFSPEPESPYGPELVLDWSAKAWTPSGTNVCVDDGDYLKITYVDDEAGCELYFREKIGDLYAGTDLIPGRTYLLRVNARVDILTANARTWNVTEWYSLPSMTTEFAWYEHIFQPGDLDGVATAKLRWQDLGAGEAIYVADVSLREIL